MRCKAGQRATNKCAFCERDDTLGIGYGNGSRALYSVDACHADSAAWQSKAHKIA